MGLKQFIQLLSSKQVQIPKSRKAFVKECILEAMQEEDKKDPKDDNDASNDDDDESEEESEDEIDTTPTKKKGGLAAKKPLSAALSKFLGHACGLAAKKPLSAALSKFLGHAEMARTEIVKALWAYIRKHDLQNPDNRKEILLDDAMRGVFGCERFTMFTMNKYVSAHIHPFTKVDLEHNSSRSPSSSSSSRTPSRQAKKRARTKSSSSTTPKRSTSSAEKVVAKRRKKVGTQPPYRLSEALQAVVGAEILPRPQVVSQLWNYIKRHELQQASDKRQIRCDDLLRKVMGGKATVTMFNMNQYITPHLIEKLDKKEYQNHNNQEDGDDE
eukprot:CAMPEP_0168746434 /NCGR_PEP_ID=MMETSP0724-20121128/15147_1 /TAXON_ID=265536 /ORGANISM="Amphiprora sp., Strain CCMP467" /LENGTH=327 /DNA_ID=CAMNT_0008794209 /DNA_START=39 /DNA_END=1022 /DNA_ORIENTATION=-